MNKSCTSAVFYKFNCYNDLLKVATGLLTLLSASQPVIDVISAQIILSIVVWPREANTMISPNVSFLYIHNTSINVT